MNDGPVTVVVPTRNSEETLSACLESVRAQDYPDVELIVVDNNSTDSTREIAERHADRVLVAGPERSAQRNIGAREGRGGYLLFVDSDMILEPGVVREGVEALRNGASAVVVPEQTFGEGYWARCKALERACYLGDDTIEAARFFTREAFDEAGGYDEEIPAGPEDWDISQRVVHADGPAARTDSFIWHDEGRLRLRQTMATKYYYGRGTAVYLEKHPEAARRQLRFVRPAFLRNWRKLAAKPFVAVGVITMKVCELTAGAVGLASARRAARREAATR